MKKQDIISELLEKGGLKRTREEEEAIISYYLRRFRVEAERGTETD